MADDYLKSLLKKVSSTGEKIEQGEVKKQELEKQVKKIETIATKAGVKKEHIKKILKDLKEKINQVLSSEGKLLFVQEKDEKLIEDINSHLKDLEDKFSLNQQKIQDITNSINDFKAKLSQILEIKIERDKRMQELEEKIASTVDKNFQEVMKIEQQIADLEEKYTKLADLEEHDSESLRKIRIKIRQLKQLLEIKKEEYAKKSKIPLPELRPKLIASIKPFPRKPEIRHEMRIFPTPPEIPKELKPMPPKKFGIPKKPEPIWREKISLRKEEGIRLKPEEEIPYKPKPELPSLPSFKEVLPGLPKLKPEEFKPFPPKIKPFPEFKTFEEQVMPSPPTHVLRRELPPIPEPPRPPRIEGELLPPSMAFPRKLTFWDKIKNIFRKKT